MTTPTCESATSADVLEAARLAAAAHSSRLQPLVIQQLPEKQRPLLPLLMALLDSAEPVARAIDDNAWDDGVPLDRQLAEQLAGQAYRLGDAITNAAHAHDTRNWNLPSMTGKEMV